MTIKNKIKKSILYFIPSRDHDLIVMTAKAVLKGFTFRSGAEIKLLSYLDWYKQYNIANKKDLLNLEVDTTIEETGFLKSHSYLTIRYFFINSARGFLKYSENSTIILVNILMLFKRIINRFFSFIFLTLFSLVTLIKAILLNLKAILLNLIDSIINKLIAILKYLFVAKPISFLLFLIGKSRVNHLFNYSRMAAYNILQGDGDLKNAASAFEKINNATNNIFFSNEQKLDNFILKLIKHIQNVEKQISLDNLKINNDKSNLVISLAIWGVDYTETFMKYCLPSLFTKENYNYLKSRNLIWHIFTDEITKNKLNKAFNNSQKDLFKNIRYEVIPKNLINNSKGDHRYWLFGGLTQTSFRLAYQYNADIHFMNPDIIYSNNFFKVLLETSTKLNPKVILMNSFRTNISSIKPILDKIKKNNVINLDYVSLNNLIVDHLHRVYDNSFPKISDLKKGIYPNVTVIAKMLEDKIIMHTPHYQPMLVSKKVLRKNLKLSYFTIDSLIFRLKGINIDNKKNVIFLDSSNEISYLEMSNSKTFHSVKYNEKEFFTKFGHVNLNSEAKAFRKNIHFKIDKNNNKFFRKEPLKKWNVELEYLFKKLDVHVTKNTGIRSGRFRNIHHYALLTDRLCGQEINSLSIEKNDEVFQKFENDFSKNFYYYDTPHERALMNRFFVNLLRLGAISSIDFLLSKINEQISKSRKTNPVEENLLKIYKYSKTFFSSLENRGIYYRKLNKNKDIYVVGSLVWGKKYIDDFLNINLKSMLSKMNIPHVSKIGKVVNLIITDSQGSKYLQKSEIIKQLKKFSSVEIFVLDDEIAEIIKNDHLSSLFYMKYGILDHGNIFFAKGANANIFCIPVDSVVAEGSMKNLINYLNEGFHCSGGGNIVANSKSFVKHFNKNYEKKKVISINTKQLVNVALKNHHHYFKSQEISYRNNKFGKHARELFLPEKNIVKIRSVFIHPLILSKESITKYCLRPHLANIDYGLIPRVFDDVSDIKIADPLEVYINNFAPAERLFETTENFFDPIIFINEHKNAHLIQTQLFSFEQVIPCDASLIGREMDETNNNIQKILKAFEQRVLNFRGN